MAEAHVSGLRAQHVSAVQRFDQRKGRFDSSATKRSRCFWSAFVTDFWSTTWSKSSLIAFAISLTVSFGVSRGLADTLARVKGDQEPLSDFRKKLAGEEGFEPSIP